MMTMVQASQVLAAPLRGGDCVFDSVSTDTRSIESGALYVALKGERFDGHDFIADAERGGAVGVVVSQLMDSSLPQIQVVDTRLALGELAAAWRLQFKGPVIGITGSNGKTTVKEMVASILSEKGQVLATRGNFNNDIGLPLTLLRIRENDEFAVIEMGANHSGEIDYLTQLTRPDVAVITNAGPAHLEGFGSIEGVARAKGEIYAGLQETGTAVINADDAYAAYWLTLCEHKEVLRFGLQAQDADVKGEWQPSEAGGHLAITTVDGRCELKLALPGQHNAMNALAATAASIAAGATLENVQRALSRFKSVKGRLNVYTTQSGMKVIDDTYNANPASLDAGLDVLTQMDGRHWLVLGDMGELGEDSRALHQQAGRSAKQKKLHCLLAIGENSQEAVRSFGENATHFLNQDALITYIKKHSGSDVNVLIKGSRSMHMEQIVEALVGETA